MLSDLRSIESGLRLGQAISGPFAQAMIAKKQREQDLQDQDKSTQLKLALLAAEHPEYGLVQQPSAYDQDAGMRVGTPQAISDTEQSRLDAGGSYTPKKTDYQSIGDTGFSSSPSMAADYRRKERQQKLDDTLEIMKEEGSIKNTGMTRQENLRFQHERDLLQDKYSNAKSLNDDEAASKYRLEMDKLERQNPMGLGPLSDRGQANDQGVYPDALKNIDPGTAQRAKLLSEYKIPYPGSFALKDPQWKAAISAAEQYDPSFDASQYQNRQKLRNDFMSGKSAGNVRSLNTAIGHLKTLSDAGDALDNRGIPLWNSIANKAESALGDPRVVKFDTAANAVQNELAAAFKGSGATDQEIKEWRKSFDSAQSPAQLKAAIKQAVDLLGSRMEALNSQYKNGLGKPKDFHFLNDKSRSILSSFGADPEEWDSISGQSEPPSKSSGKSVGGYKIIEVK